MPKKRNLSDTTNGDKSSKRPNKKWKKKEIEQEEKESSDDIGPGGIDDEEIDSDDINDQEESDEEEIIETSTEKRRRLAKQYIESIKEDLDETGFDAEDIDQDLIAERLRKDVLEQTGRAHRIIADTFSFPIDPGTMKSRRHELSVTCIAIAESGQFFYTGSKDHSIIKWCIKTGKRLHVFPGGRKEVKKFDGHTNHVLALAVSSDENYMASGGSDKKINIWSTKEDKLLKCFTQHKDSVSGLAFRKGNNQLYSASQDRTVKVWNVDELCYVETLFGHQDQILAIDTLSRERCVTVGSRDRTCRLWKIVEGSQLVFRGNTKCATEDGQAFQEGSLDVVAMIDEDNFLSGGDSGAISLWNINKKKPVFVHNIAHGLQTYDSESEGPLKNPYWITSLATVKYSDLFASGSYDGNIRLWKLIDNIRSFVPLTEISLIGFVNALQFATIEDKTFLIAGVGQEHKLGRWKRIKNARNGWRLMELPLKSQNNSK
ncbi:WD40 repeat-like protein [Gigaspora margarita]|uniref:WD40 repeat-like protein n=1 Tax=Gigaspora margarita TaxID=4874 RepID=A0A8H4A022_GIGMA|nr:WD40 repeat-like protein [Gigaspora margarita]